MYDHNLPQESNNKWGGKSKLKKILTSELPEHINLNINRYKDWLD